MISVSGGEVEGTCLLRLVCYPALQLRMGWREKAASGQYSWQSGAIYADRCLQLKFHLGPA